VSLEVVKCGSVERRRTVIAVTSLINCGQMPDFHYGGKYSGFRPMSLGIST
jgi:hypothetical protein